MRTLTLITLLCSAVFASCEIGPSPMVYGSDACAWCSMTIVDPVHGSQIVTGKGKAFKFDAIECMMGYLQNQPDTDAALVLVNTHDQPNSLNDASACTFLISEGLPSPMGANLTAFTSEEAADRIRNQLDGNLYSWESLPDSLIPDP